MNKRLMAMAMGAAGIPIIEQMEEKRKNCISNNLDKIDTTVHTVIPKDAGYFWFDADGNCYSKKPKKETVYECVALSRKRAIQKWEKQAK